MSKKKFPGLSALAASIAMSFNPAARAAAERAKEEDRKQAAYRICSEVVGYAITTEWAYVKAIAGAPMAVALDESVHPYAWELVAPSWLSSSIDAPALLKHYAALFATPPIVDVKTSRNGIPHYNNDPDTLRNAIRHLQAIAGREMLAGPPKVGAPCICDYQDLQPLGECICGANKPYNPANDGNKASR